MKILLLPLSNTSFPDRAHFRTRLLFLQTNAINQNKQTSKTSAYPLIFLRILIPYMIVQATIISLYVSLPSPPARSADLTFA